MAIRIRRGNQVDFEKNKLVQGELAIVQDAGELHFCYGAGNTKRLATKEDLQEMLDMSDTSFSALIQLIADLENDPNELTNILSNISDLQSNVDTINNNLGDVNSQLADIATSINTFAGIDKTGLTDSSAGIKTAIEFAADNKIKLVFNGTYKIDNCMTVTKDNIHLDFNNCTFNIADTGTDGELTNGSTGKIGLLFKNCDNLQIDGYAKCIGQGTEGTTSLTGIVFDHCDNAKVPCRFYFENMAAGRFIMWCDDSEFGNITAYKMKGTQTFDSGTAGSAEVVIGCKDTHTGKIISFENYKPIRYLSIAYDGETTAIDNENCEFGFVYGTAAVGSIESSVIAIRSAVNCIFDGGAGEGFTCGLNIVKYDTDDDFNIDGNKIRVLYGDYPSTGASVDTAINTNSYGTKPIGTNVIDYVKVTCAGEYGMFCFSGELNINTAEISGGGRCFSVLNSKLKCGKLKLSNSTSEMGIVGANSGFYADLIDISTGATSTPTSAIKIDDDGNTSVIDIQRIKYRQNAVGNNFVYVIMDLGNAYNNTTRHIGNIDGTGSNAPARFGADEWTITNGALDLKGTKLWNPGELADGASVMSTDIVVVGANFGDYILVSPPYNTQGVDYRADISAAGIVKIKLHNTTGAPVDLPEGTWKVKVIKA